MPEAVRLGDTCTGHGCWPARANVGASGDVFANGRGAHRVGDPWAAHTCLKIPETHASIQDTGSPNVFVNGRPWARVGDAVACGSSNATGSPDVVVNG
ncbi:PaaR repeat-containing protein [Roseospira marina]|uniref:PaaR repeat-containing protein n=1 Tax=Roseospira marina TaxID=140057 RepID=A0A5M6I3L3_9PROT|nr:PAAR domain-containing protein [Roseospira marina]KAA5602800.1 PaaR repeat-containing protein [Roseospira marina]MBB4316225.1 putative Zn-binding protein involved in type VI secretion [Roseospira marina]MBB5089428.1 putative Zn-binding protein involved in type VI secretion [Roseospira marina]